MTKTKIYAVLLAGTICISLAGCGNTAPVSESETVQVNAEKTADETSGIDISDVVPAEPTAPEEPEPPAESSASEPPQPTEKEKPEAESAPQQTEPPVQTEPQKPAEPAEPQKPQEPPAAQTQPPVAAYCRVSTKQEEQLNSYETQVRYYTDRINRESGWKLAGIYADKGITGTSMKKRDEFNKLIRQCRRGKVDMIIVKSISRFARNTLDCIRITRMLREIKVDVYFEEQNLHSIDPASEFYISIYGSIAQSESENISHNVAWGKARSAKDGNVFFAYKSFLGYRRGEDGKPEIDPEQAVTVRLIYDWFLSGKSLPQIAKELTESGIPTPMGRTVWQPSVVQSILSNEKYKGDALLGKTYIVDCISKKKCVNAGERVQYYVENNHPAIIDAATFDRVQEELARRAGKRKVKQVGTTTEQGKYCGKYALTELLVCGECGTPYRRCTWTVRGEKKIVWRCISRLDYGKKYCHHSPTMEEAPLQEAIMNAIMKTAQVNPEILQTLKMHIQMGLGAQSGEDKSVEAQIRIAQIDREFKEILNGVTAENQDSLLSDPRIEELISEKRMLENRLAQYSAAEQHRKNTMSRLDQIFAILDTMKNHPLTYDDLVVRQILQSVIVESKQKIKVIFLGGLEVEAEVEQ